MSEMEAANARTIAERFLAKWLPRRWAHVRSVAARAAQIAVTLGIDERALATAAWLHDIGYAPELVHTGFHPLDGALYLRQLGMDNRTVCLVAHHSCARVEADERGLLKVLDREFPEEESATADALWYCDLTTGPDGHYLTATERLNEIRSRYGPDHVATRFIKRAEGELMDAVRRTEDRLATANPYSPAKEPTDR